MNSRRLTFLLLSAAVLTFTLACRTADTIAQLRASPAATRARATRAATRVPTRVSKQPTTIGEELPTEITAVTDLPPTPSNPQPRQPPTQASKSAAPTRKPPAPPPSSPVSRFKYLIQESRCSPNVRTFIEGFVYENNVPKNDVLVRISQGPDGQPDPNDDYRTGTDPRKGYFFQNIDSNAPRAGTWYLWVIDPGTQQRISEIAIVKTDAQRVEDNENSSGSCQSAQLKFSTSGPVTNPAPTGTPSRTPNPDAQPTPTQDPLNDS